MLSALEAYQRLGQNMQPPLYFYASFTEPSGNPYIFCLNCSVVLNDLLGLDCPACDLGVSTLSFPINSPCGLRACAQHDQCYDNNNCTASSWVETFSDLRQIASGNWPTLSPCVKCNLAVLAAMNNCKNGFPSQGPMYYCRYQHRFISIPGDFATLKEAKNACCNNPPGCPKYPDTDIPPGFDGGPGSIIP
jgi:hypothetical protein